MQPKRSMLGTACVLAAGDFCIATRSLALQREFELPIVQGISLDAARVSKLGLVLMRYIVEINAFPFQFNLI